MEFRQFSVNDDIEIFGHIFNGLKDIMEAVEVRARVKPYSDGDRDIYRKTPKKPQDGLHVLELYMPYPTFDDDFSENRDYSNFFFSNKPFTDSQIIEIADTHATTNYCLVNEQTDEAWLPAIFYQGDSFYGVKVAYPTIKANS